MTDRESLSMAELIEAIGEQVKLTMHTSMPAQVVSYDDSRNTVEVQPVLKRKRENGSSVAIAPIVEVPVCFYRAGGFAVTVKPQSGDYCVLVFQERSIDLWKRAGGVIDPKKPRKFSLTDAVAVFGAWPFADALPSVKSGIDLRTDDGQASLNLTGSEMSLALGGASIFTATASGVIFDVDITAPNITATGIAATTVSAGGIDFDSHAHAYSWTDPAGAGVTGSAQ